MNKTLLRKLALDAGIHFPGPVEFIPEGVASDYNLAMDAQPALVTVTNAGIPAYLANYVDPALIEVLIAPMKAAQILGESKKGDWTMDTATFGLIESTGEASSYGDYSENGSTGVNANWPMRQQYRYQTVAQWGDLELEKWGLARIDFASRLKIAKALTLNKYQNSTYFFGVSGLQNYGLLNDSSLVASISPTAAWSLEATTGAVVYDDIRRIFAQLQTQMGGTINMEQEMVLAMSPTTEVSLTKTNTYNVNVVDQIKKNFPNMRIETAPEYTTASGELVQLIAMNVEGQQTATCAFSEKMRAHGVVRKASSFQEKMSQGTWGTIIFRPAAIASMIGV